MVPFTIGVDSPMTEKEHVRAIHVIATSQSAAERGHVSLHAAVGPGLGGSRLRLAQTQDVIGLAELGDGRFLMTRRPVKVTIGGCGG